MKSSSLACICMVFVGTLYNGCTFLEILHTKQKGCCRSSKQDCSVSSGTWHGWAIRKTCPYVDSRVTQGLEAPPRTSMSHLATDHGSRPPAAQSRSELSLATRSGPRTMEATRGNGYAPVSGMPAMMMKQKSETVYRMCVIY